VLESGLPEAIAVDDWVHGRTDSVDFKTQLGPDYNDSEVIRRAMSWLREWNLGAGRAHPVAVYGADMSIGDGRSMLPALYRLQAMAGTDARITAVLDSLRPLATRVAAAWWNGALRNYTALPAADKGRLTELTTRLVAAAREWRGGTRDQKTWAERLALIAQQDEVMLRRGPFSPEVPRDAAMAANTRWIVDRLPSGERAMLWAHNAHVQRTLITGPALPRGAFPSMGYRLGNALGAGYSPSARHTEVRPSTAPARLAPAPWMPRSRDRVGAISAPTARRAADRGVGDMAERRTPDALPGGTPRSAVGISVRRDRLLRPHRSGRATALSGRGQQRDYQQDGNRLARKAQRKTERTRRTALRVELRTLAHLPSPSATPKEKTLGSASSLPRAKILLGPPAVFRGLRVNQLRLQALRLMR
jgi:hypothetical protein